MNKKDVVVTASNMYEMRKTNFRQIFFLRLEQWEIILMTTL
jgi:hypothetical protein